MSVTLDRQREWDEAIRLHFYNQENELFLHGGWSLLSWHSCVVYSLSICSATVFEGNPPDPGQLCEGEDSELIARNPFNQDN